VHLSTPSPSRASRTGCGLPPEFCEFSGKFEACKPWLIANFPALYPQLLAGGGGGAGDLAAKMASASLGPSTAPAASGDADAAAAKKGKSKKDAAVGRVFVEVKEQGKRRKITAVSGLEAYNVKLKDAASALGKKFGAGGSVGKSATGVAQVDIQGDVAYELPELLHKLYGVPEALISVRGLED
jgi:density-regulated protein DRP1